MADYLLMIWENRDAHAKATPADYQQLLDAHASFGKRIRRETTVHDANRLRPIAEAKRVGLSRGRAVVHEGPVAETKEVIGGYYVFSAEGIDAATKVAADCPCLPGDSVEVRPIMGRYPGNAAKDKPGKAFFFGVLGSAPTEAAWTGVMDRIDEETSSSMPKEGMLGGVRLEAPSTGRVVRNESGKRVVADGPFAETKEVIGGLVCLRMPGMEDALRWASDSRFVQHGTLEVRELWWM